MPKLRFYRMADPFIGVGCQWRDGSWCVNAAPAFSINLELLLFGIALEWRKAPHV